MGNKEREVHTCPDCGEGATVRRGDYQFTESGLKNVVLSGVEITHCPKCGDSVSIPKMNQLMRVMALGVALKPAPLKGEELRFLRKFMEKTQDDLAAILNVHKTTISKWENDEDRIGDQSDRLIRLVAISEGGLKDEVNNVIHEFPSIKEKQIRGSSMHVDVEAGKARYAVA
jgi:putative transcriptional regulator